MSEAVERASRQSGSNHVEAPGLVAHALAQNWSFCVWRITDSWEQVTPQFRSRIIEQYLVFILNLGWEPSEVHLGASRANSQGLEVWRDLFASELKARFIGSAPLRRAALEEAMKSLDHGKRYVFQGYPSLEEQLTSTAH